MPLSFVSPLILAALAGLPALWWLLRVVPPAPRRIVFPPIRLLGGLASNQRQTAKTPLWLVLMRLVLAALVIVGAAHPLLRARPVVAGGPLLVVVDDGWASARQWPERRALLDDWLREAERQSRPVALLTTAPPADGGPVPSPRLRSPGEAKAAAEAVVPHPWPTDHRAAVKALDAAALPPPLRVLWLADGLDDPALRDFAARLRRLGPVEMAAPPEAAAARLLTLAADDTGELRASIRRPAAALPETVTLRAADTAGRTVAEASTTLAAGRRSAELALPMPAELKARVARLGLAGEASAGAVALVDDRWRRRVVGLVDEIGAGTGASPLLDDLYYAERALAPLAEVRRGHLDELLRRDLSLIILPDQGGLAEQQHRQLEEWVRRGGVLLRLAGPKLARNPDELLPVRLLSGGRLLGGALSWTRPMAMNAMPDDKPFAGLAVPGDIRVSAQVLAEPVIDLNDRTWARLEDGTPLVTGAPRGKGTLVLVHTSIGPAWSNLGLSGLFPAMLERLIRLSRGVPPGEVGKPLAPAELLDGFGRLVPPSGIAEALPPPSPRATPPVPGPRHPPGLYGDDRMAFNLGPAIADLTAAGPLEGVSRVDLTGLERAVDLQPGFFAAALLLLMADMIAVLALAGLLRRRAAVVTLLVLLSLLADHPLAAAAAATDSTQAAVLKTRLAYVVTGDGEIDQTSRAGLAGLSRLIERRTTAVLGEPVGVDPSRDPLMVFPLLYWPVVQRAEPPDAAARERINDFMRHGGMILFDTRDGGEDGPEKLRRLTGELDIPPLAEVTDDHVLSHSFYLLRSLPGRTTGAPVYVQDGGDPSNDNVSPVVIGANDWAAAWAVDERGRPLYAVVPGGDAQREQANRFGVNLVMYALTGSYKADQVHLPAILERLKK
ncbi:MAG TPA: DUF4159 domain-containing protein [Rhodospirillaceae bacterium]|nr:DUF4159 domain-containing protein [Rhodospirillaceae bacterium]